MRMLRLLPVRALLSLCCRRGLATLGIILGSLWAAAAGAILADQALEARRRALWAAEINRSRSDWMTPEVMEKMDQEARFGGGLPSGSEAPDFALPDTSRKLVTLSSFRGKRPVVLVFGSFGCDLFCDSLGQLRRLHEGLRGRVEFLFVYIREAPHDSTPLPSARRPIPSARGAASGLERVRWYEEETGGGLRWLVDGEDRRVEELYSAWPRRLVIVGTDGRVAFDAGHGLSNRWDMAEIGRHLWAAMPHGDLH